MKVPHHTDYGAFNQFLRYIQENGWTLLYSIGETRVLGKRGDFESRVKVNPGFDVYFEGDGDIRWN